MVAGTPQDRLVEPSRPKGPKDVSPGAMARLERELGHLQEAISTVQDSYGKDQRHLMVVMGYFAKQHGSARVVRYLAHKHPKFLSVPHIITEMTSNLPFEAKCIGRQLVFNLI